MEKAVAKIKDDVKAYDSDTHTDFLTRKVRESAVLLQDALEKTNEQLYDETAYTELELILLAAYTVYELLLIKVTEANTGNAAGEKARNAIKKVKADVVEIEYATGKGSGSMSIDAETLLPLYKQRVCQLAALRKITLALCQEIKESSAARPFKFYQTIQ